MDERMQHSMLIDIYGELLTDKQLDILNLYYEDDLSLAEISELTNTSRQAIHDLIKRCNKLLQSYEEKLKLLESAEKLKSVKSEILTSIDNLMEITTEENQRKMINEIRKNIIDKI